jgi:AraC-like DNA-binding protein
MELLPNPLKLLDLWLQTRYHQARLSAGKASRRIAENQSAAMRRTSVAASNEMDVTMLTGDTHMVEHPAATGTEGGTADVETLARLLRAYSPHDGRFPLAVPGLYALRLSRTDTELVYTTYRPSLCLVAQGAKSVVLEEEVYAYDEARLIVFSVDLPVAGQVTRASAAAPFLCLQLALDPQRIAELVLKIYPHGVPPVTEKRGISIGHTSAPMVNAATRLMELLGQPEEAEFIAPLVVDEILTRLLLSPLGGRVAQLGYSGSSVQRIGSAVAWLRANYAQPTDVEELAAMVHMSVPTFHQHFKAVTAMSPLQFQKALRLQEARRLLVSVMQDVGTASRQVGYASVSQFSREYSRYFGSPPSRDISRIRAQRVAAR